MEGIYTEKEILTDALNTEKSATNLFNMSANECVHDGLRNTMMSILEKEHDIQIDVFNEMHARGFYPTPAADSKKIQQAKQTYSCSATSMR